MNTETSHCPNCAGLSDRLSAKDQDIHALLARIDDLVRHDPLTGVLNRRTLIDALESELQRAHRTGHPFCFAILDLDNFGEVNDKYGHPAGDAVLKTVSDTAIKLLRVLDRFGRLGGKQFGIVMPATWLDQGAIAVGRLRNAAASINWGNTAPELMLTFSAGITTNAPGDNAESIAKRAEQALRQAKQAGGNRTVQAEEALPPASLVDPD